MSAREEVSEEMPEQRVLGDLERGRDLSRIVAFSDGVFAIAATLLILQIDVPAGIGSSSALWDGVTDQSSDLYAYVFSFMVIGFFWTFHHRLMRKVREFDRGLMLLNLLYLMMIVLIPFTSQIIGEYGEYFSSVVLYAVNMSLVSLAMFLLERHCLTRDLLMPGYERDTALMVKSNLYNACIFLTAIPAALLVGGFALFIWVLLWLDPFERQRDRLAAEAAAGHAGKTEPDA